MTKNQKEKEDADLVQRFSTAFDDFPYQSGRLEAIASLDGTEIGRTTLVYPALMIDTPPTDGSREALGTGTRTVVRNEHYSGSPGSSWALVEMKIAARGMHRRTEFSSVSTGSAFGRPLRVILHLQMDHELLAHDTGGVWGGASEWLFGLAFLRWGVFHVEGPW